MAATRTTKKEAQGHEVCFVGARQAPRVEPDSLARLRAFKQTLPGRMARVNPQEVEANGLARARRSDDAAGSSAADWKNPLQLCNRTMFSSLDLAIDKREAIKVDGSWAHRAVEEWNSLAAARRIGSLNAYSSVVKVLLPSGASVWPGGVRNPPHVPGGWSFRKVLEASEWFRSSTTNVTGAERVAGQVALIRNSDKKVITRDKAGGDAIGAGGSMIAAIVFPHPSTRSCSSAQTFCGLRRGFLLHRRW
jgi:hypothetical protein